MRLTDLAKVLRDAGLKVSEVPGWRNRGHGDFRAVQSIICHHTAGPATGDMPSLGVVTNGRVGLAGPLCNLGLGRDGTWHVIAAGYAWHAGDVARTAYRNDYSIGIEAEATGVAATWPAAQMESYARGCAALAKHYGVPVSNVLGHKEVAVPIGRKIDPNFDMAAFRRDVARLMEDDMPLTPDDIEKVADRVVAKLLAAPVVNKNPDGTNSTTTLGKMLTNLEVDGDRIKMRLKDLG